VKGGWVAGRADPAYVAVIGAWRATESQQRVAEEVGRGLAEAGAVVITGGGTGVMEGASRGAAQAGGTVVGILPGEHRRTANRWVGVALPTGLGDLRNGLIVRAADAMVAIGGAYGTLSEIALGLNAGLGVVGLDTWATEGVRPASSPEDAVRQALDLARARIDS
jgi:uncharacterized protein (TIGR00725 family)